MSTGTTSMSTTTERPTNDAGLRRTALASIALDVISKIAGSGADWSEFIEIASDIQRLVQPGSTSKTVAPTLIHQQPDTQPAIPAPTAARQPMIDIKDSVTDDWIICLEDGKKLKTLKRHLTGLGLTMDEYRAKWNLPADYPSVAPSYSRQRSAMAKALDFGKRPDAGADGAEQKAPKVKKAPKVQKETAAKVVTPEPAKTQDVISLTPATPAAAPTVTSSSKAVVYHGNYLPQTIVDMLAAKNLPVTTESIIAVTVADEDIYCLEDGMPVTLLKRKLRGMGMSPEAYCQKWGLPADYPMAPPTYSERRSEIAKKTQADAAKARELQTT